MSGSAIDTVSPEEQRLLDQMRADEAREEQEAPEPQPAPPPLQQQPEAPQPQEGTQQPQEGPGDQRALHEERNRRRELQARLQEAERKHAAEQARVEERLRLLSEATQQHLRAQQPKPEPEPPAPDFSTDPAGFIQHGFKTLHSTLTQLGERLNKVETGASQLSRQQQEQVLRAELAAWGHAQEQEFARAQPDYFQAMDYLKNAREGQMRALGYAPEQIRQQIVNDVEAVALRARETGQQFARMLYDVALSSAGGQPLWQQMAQNRPPGPSVPAVGAQQPAAGNATERLVRGHDMANTIGVTGAAARGDVASSAVANMSDAEFAKHLQQVERQGPAAIRALFGA